jgi:hypothetical protein
MRVTMYMYSAGTDNGYGATPHARTPPHLAYMRLGHLFEPLCLAQTQGAAALAHKVLLYVATIQKRARCMYTIPQLALGCVCHVV